MTDTGTSSSLKKDAAGNYIFAGGSACDESMLCLKAYVTPSLVPEELLKAELNLDIDLNLFEVYLLDPDTKALIETKSKKISRNYSEMDPQSGNNIFTFYVKPLAPEDGSTTTEANFNLKFGIPESPIKADDKNIKLTVAWNGGCAQGDCNQSADALNMSPPSAAGGGSAGSGVAAASASTPVSRSAAAANPDAVNREWTLSLRFNDNDWNEFAGSLKIAASLDQHFFDLENFDLTLMPDATVEYYPDTHATLAGYPQRIITPTRKYTFSYQTSVYDGQRIIRTVYLEIRDAQSNVLNFYNLLLGHNGSTGWNLRITRTADNTSTVSYYQSLPGMQPAYGTAIAPEYHVNTVLENGLQSEIAVGHYRENGVDMIHEIEAHTGNQDTDLITERFYRIFPWGKEPVREVCGDRITEWEYITDGPAPEDTEDDPVTFGYGIGQLAAVRYPDGSRVSYTYDVNSRVITQTEIRGNQTYLTTNTYSSTTVSNTPSQIVDSETRIGDALIGKTRHVTFPTKPTASPALSIRYDETGAAYTTSTTYTTDSENPGRYRISQVTYPDGTQTVYSIVPPSVYNQRRTATTVGPTYKSETVTDQRGRILSAAQYERNGNSYYKVSETVNTAFDNRDRPIATTYMDGGTATRGYSCCGLAFETDRYGITTTYDYDQNQLILSERDGIATAYTRGTAGRILKTTVTGRDDGEITTLQTYDAAGELASSTDELGQITTYATVYQRDGDDVTVTRTTTHPDGTTSVTVTLNGEVIEESGTARPYTVTYQYGPDWIKTLPDNLTTYTDRMGRNYKTVYADDTFSQNFYNNKNQLVKTVSPAGRITLYQYDTQGRQNAVITDMNASGTADSGDLMRQTTWSYSGSGNAVTKTTTVKSRPYSTEMGSVSVITKQRLDGSSTETTDIYGQVTKVTRTIPGVTVTETTTYPDQTKQVVTLANGKVTSIARIHSDNTPGSVTTITYDQFDRQFTVTETMGETVLNNAVTTYDSAGRVLTQTVNGQITTYAYDTLNRSVTASLPGGRQITQTYHPYGELKRLEGHDTYTQEWDYAWSPTGRNVTLTTWQDSATPQETVWHYDLKGNLTAKEYADGQGPAYTYDADGLLTLRTWARGLATSYTYDPAGRLTGTAYADQGVTAPVTTVYDAVGNPASITDASGTHTFTYGTSGGSRNRLTKVTLPATLNASVNYVYDNYGRRTSMSVAGGSTPGMPSNSSWTGYAYDSAGRLSGLGVSTSPYGGSMMAATVKNYTYVPGTNRVSSTKWTANNVDFLPQTYTYDLQNRLTGISDSVAYTLNDRDQRTRTTLPDGRYWLYTYDDLGQVTGAQQYTSDDTPLTGGAYTYAYDGIGNRTESAEAGQSSKDYISNLLNQYTIIGNDEIPTYDADGNILSWNGWQFTWNAENRLIKAENGTTTVEADYDYLGRRFEKKVYEGETLTQHQRFIYDGYKLIEIRDALNDNTLETAYTWQPLQLDVPVAIKQGTTLGFYQHDGNKNVTSIKALDGTILASYEYGPFGQTQSSDGAWSELNPFRFSSEYHDTETGLIYYNYRHYSPDLGRWLSRDPIEEWGGPNLYSILGNYVINNWDILGRKKSQNIKIMYEATNSEATIDLYTRHRARHGESLDPQTYGQIKYRWGIKIWPEPSTCICPTGKKNKYECGNVVLTQKLMYRTWGPFFWGNVYDWDYDSRPKDNTTFSNMPNNPYRWMDGNVARVPAYTDPSDGSNIGGTTGDKPGSYVDSLTSEQVLWVEAWCRCPSMDYGPLTQRFIHYKKTGTTEAYPKY